MDYAAFHRSLTGQGSPADLSPVLQALWHLGRKEWERAHAIAQDERGADSHWVHAHLHRVEGDLSNAAYWYARAGRSVCSGDLEAEWESIVRTLLSQSL
jgi:hypothetical protein